MGQEGLFNSPIFLYTAAPPVVSVFNEMDCHYVGVLQMFVGMPQTREKQWLGQDLGYIFAVPSVTNQRRVPTVILSYNSSSQKTIRYGMPTT